MKRKQIIFMILPLIILIVSTLVMMKYKKAKENRVVIDNKINNTSIVNNTEVKKSVESSKNNTKNDTKINTSKKFKETKEIKGFEISDISFTEKDGQAILHAIVKNISKKDKKEYTYFKITFLEKDNKEIGTISGIINPVKKNEKTELNASIRGKTKEYINAYDFKIEIDKK